MLRLSGHNPTLANGGAEALAYLSSKRFDILLSDIRMPDVDGIQVARQTAERWPEIAILLMTGDRVPQSLRWKTLEKPIVVEELLSEIERIARPCLAGVT
jgi:CheY-like chemotaxis protein